MRECRIAIRTPNATEQDAAQGDTLSLDILTDISDAREWTAVELVWLVGAATEDILQACTFEWSSDNVTWVLRFASSVYGVSIAESFTARRRTYPHLLRHHS